MRELTFDQSLAAETLDRPVSLSAAAGSGKTTVLVERYLKLLERGRQPREILTVTFTTEAARELRHRVLQELDRRERATPKLVQAIERSPYLGTLHGFCYGLLSRFGSTIGLAPLKGIVGPYEQAAAFEGSYARWLDSLGEVALRGLLTRFTPAEIREVARQIHQHRFTFAATLRHGAEELVQELATLTVPLSASLATEFHSRGLYSFDELEHFALRILRESPETKAFLRKELQAVLVDEFQDTSRSQWAILTEVIGERLDKLFVVGDPKQSIYGFRQADVSLFLEVSALMQEKNGANLELKQNFRSHPDVLTPINQLARTLFEGSAIGYAEMESGRPGDEVPSQRVSLALYEAGESKPLLYRKEIELAVRTVLENLRRGIPAEDMAILFRVSDRILEYADALLREGVPVVARKSGALFEAYDVIDIASLLRALLDPLDDYRLGAFLRSSFAQLSYAELYELTRREGKTLFEKLMTAPPTKVAWFVGLVEAGTFEVEEVLRAAFEGSGYWPSQSDAVFPFLEAISGKGWNLPRAVETLGAWQKEGLSYGSESMDRAAKGVRLMTVHGAKGLEFPHVLLVDTLRQLPRRSPAIRLHADFPPGLRYHEGDEVVTTPAYEAIGEAQRKNDLEESKRILYVALTRAKESLTVFLPRDPNLTPKESWGEWLRAGLANNPRLESDA